MSKIDEQIKELEARKKNIGELQSLKQSIGKMLTETKLQQKVIKFVVSLKDALEEGLNVDDVKSDNNDSSINTQFSPNEANVLKSLAAKALQRQVPKPQNNELSQQLYKEPNTPVNPQQQVITSGLADIDPIRFHQMMAQRIGKAVTDLRGKEIGVLHQQSYPELIIKKPNGNTVELNANKVFVENK